MLKARVPEQYGTRRTRAPSAKVAKVREQPERMLSAALATLLDSQGVEIRGVGFHVHNENPSGVGRAIPAAMGARRGVADWIFAGPPLVAVELKVGRRQQSRSQRLWEQELLSGWNLGDLSGWELELPAGDTWSVEAAFRPRYAVCRSLSEVVSELYEAKIWKAPLHWREIERKIALVQAHFWQKWRKEVP